MHQPQKNIGSTLSSGYRYSFQGQEKDDEIKGEGNSINYTYRMHDPRLGRFFAVDPLAAKYPHNSPYAFSENKVIQFVELEGLEVKAPDINQGYNAVNHAEDFDGVISDAYTIISNYMFRIGYYDEMPRKLIYHYTYGQGESYQLSNDEAEQLHAIPVGIPQDFIDGCVAKGEGKYTYEGQLKSTAQNNGTLGRFTVAVKGTVTVNNDGSWTFEGKMQFQDDYDFNIEGFNTTRTAAAEALTMIGNVFLPGQKFSVTSGWIEIKQNSGEAYFDWFKGKSWEPIPNRLVSEENESTEGEGETKKFGEGAEGAIEGTEAED